MRRLLILLLLGLSAWASHAGELLILVDTGTEMPMARIEGNQVLAGVHADIGLALAHHLGRTARFLALPRKRIPLALEDGSGDVLCMYLPEWMPGNFSWTQPFFPQAEVLLTARRLPAPHKLGEVAGQPVGTVLGYAYPEMDKALGAGFRRSDSPSTELNMAKMAAGRIDHALSNELWFRWRMRQGGFGVDLHPPLMVQTIVTSCAVSRKGRVSLAQVNAALEAMQRKGDVAAVLRRYGAGP